ncbi:AI-2E family transporter [Dactylosporangium matsuzakiense]|uniref:AI-2E family transporter n=1 Tax=Dactylosporangium matsuzakiense TaxID=53360 RepID=A0A9W6NMV2_9ACTN|nr:AI-2E family transporter [Dactylosporangium matsuzakiense]UWZ41592.1 AI-2E family transporter [Dactylosporangium matsuzakiense]GLL02337.1 AI-2E family transporter [Dactylosporangium matsuzakiense]
MNPRLRRLGRIGWAVTGIVGGAALTAAAAGVLVPLLMPVLLMVVIAVAVHPLLGRLRDAGLPAGPATLFAALVLPLGLLLVGGLVVWVLVEQAEDWPPVLAEAGRWLRVLDVQTQRAALLGLGSAVVDGAVVAGQVTVGFLVGTYLLYYLLRDGPRVARGRVPASAATQLRRYMVGTTVVAAMDAAVITLGAAILRLPFLLTIAVITFVAAFVPYLGAWVSAVFVVLLALGAGGAATAVWMAVIVLVTQNVLEGVLRPYVFGRALNLHPVVVLGVTVLGAALGGLCGVFLAPPLAAVIRSWWATRRGAPPVPRP